MKSIKEVKQWLLENRKDTFGNLDLSKLDFSDFDGAVYINNMKVKKTLNQSYQEVGENLYQAFQKADKDLFQDHQQVGGELLQNNQKVKENLYQSNQTVGKNFYNHKLNKDEYWEEEESCVVRKKKLQTITRKQLAEMGYKLEDDKYEI